jgi:hypothetical protein
VYRATVRWHDTHSTWAGSAMARTIGLATGVTGATETIGGSDLITNKRTIFRYAAYPAIRIAPLNAKFRNSMII